MKPNVVIRRRGKNWYVFVTYQGRRVARSVGPSKKFAGEIAEQIEEKIKEEIRARLILGDLSTFGEAKSPIPSFRDYAQTWLRQYAELECKPSTVAGYRSILETRLLPVFGDELVDRMTRPQVKGFLSDLATTGLSRNTLRNTLCTLRVILNQAIEDGLIDRNPAARLGRFAKSRRPKYQASALTQQEAETLLQSALEVCPDYYGLFLAALRAGLRRGELVALQWGDIQFGANDDDPNRYILVQHNYVARQFTTPKSKKSRRVDLSRQLRAVLLKLRDSRMLEAFANGRTSILDEFVFPSPEGSVLDPDNLVKRYFLPAIEHAGLRRIRFHDLRHTFGSLLIQGGASVTYVKEQMGHSSIQVTVDTYGHLIPGANVNWVDRLDATPEPQQTATKQQQCPNPQGPDSPQPTDKIGGGGWTRTNDLGIMRPSL
jgi:integrase